MGVNNEKNINTGERRYFFIALLNMYQTSYTKSFAMFFSS